MALNIPVSWVRTKMLRDGKEDFPVLRVQDTISYLVRSNNVSKLVGDLPVDELKPTLLEFWRRFSIRYPGHQIYKACDEGALSLSRTIPLYIHGDEGRGFKRLGIMILSIQGAIGRGSRPFKKRHVLQTLRKVRMGTNIGGSSFSTRFLFAAAPKKWYNTIPET